MTDPAPLVPTPPPTYPPSRQGWVLVAMLTVAYVLSYIDRSILGLLVEPIKAQLKVSDAQMGVLIGLAFGLFYATVGIPLGWLADRQRRTWIVGLGVGLWSLATAVSGLANSFGHLFLARMGVGVGEATLGPCAMSMIGDSFPPERRGRPVALYSSAVSLGAGIAALVGAAVLTWAKTSSGIDLPLIGATKPWQFAFLIVGLPGLVLGLAFLFIREPPRQVSDQPGAAKPGIGDLRRHISANAGSFFGVTGLVGVMTIIAYSQGFVPSAFSRHFGWEPRLYSLVNGVLLLLLGPLTVNLVGLLCDRWRKAGRADAPFVLLAIGFVGMVISNGLALLMPDAMLAFVCLSLGTISIATVTVAGIVALLDITPAAIRGQTVALYYMVISMTGLLLGPTTVGLLSSRFYGEARLHLAIATVPILYGIVPLLLLPAIGRAYARQAEALRRAATAFNC